MRKYYPLFFLLLCFFSLPLEGAEKITEDIQLPNFIIHTWGGGPFLAKVLDALSVLLYGTKEFKGLLLIGLTIGGFTVCITAIAKGSFEFFLSHWFFPSLLIFGIILVPKDKVYIKDHMIAKSGSTQFGTVWVCKDLPYIMKVFCSTVSTMSYRLTHGLERVTHAVEDSKYNWTGHIYAGDTLFQAGKIRINNSSLESNIHNFVYNCVFNDISMQNPVYTKHDLMHAKDIVSYLIPRTSVWLSTRQTDSSGETKSVRCKKAIENIQVAFGNMEIGSGASKIAKTLSKATNTSLEVNDALKTKIFGEISSGAKDLMGLKTQSLENHKKLLQQSYMIDATHNALDPKAYATKKAEQIHMQSQGILGAMGAKSIVAMKNLFEGIVYMSFPIILLLGICFMGFRSLVTWASFLVWINLWPPFFVIINFMLNTTWDYRMSNLFGTKADVGFTMFSSSGLAELYTSMESIAAGALFSVPFLAFAIVKGGVSSMMHLAGTLNAPAQGAATQSANEQVSGNYSLGNFSYGNENISSRHMLNWNDTPTLSQGSMGHNDGHFGSKVDTSGNLIISKAQSNFGADISLDEAYGKTLNEQFLESKSKSHNASESMNASFSAAAHSGKSFMDTLGKDDSFSHLQSKAEQDSATETFSKTEQQLLDFSENYGVSRDQAIKMGSMARAGLDIGKFGSIGGSIDTSENSSRSSSELFAMKQNEAEQIGENLQKLRQYTESDSRTQNLSASQKASADFGEQLSKTDSWTAQYQEAQTNMDSWNEAAQNYESLGLSGKQNLNNAFTKHLLDNKDIGDVKNVINNPEELREAVHDFATVTKGKNNQNFEELSKKINEKMVTLGSENKMVKGQKIERNTNISEKAKVDAGLHAPSEWSEKYKSFDTEHKAKSPDDNWKNHIKAQEQIDEKKVEMSKTKVSQERKDEIKDRALNETIFKQGSGMKTVQGIGKIGKQVLGYFKMPFDGDVDV